jgi:glutamate-1-semialdehyde 2,1-aminomutase
MNLIAEGKVIHAGTMNSSNSTVAAAIGTLEVLESENVYERIFKLGRQLMEGLREIGKRQGSNFLVQGLGPMLHTGFTDLAAVYDFRDVLTYDKIKLNKFIAGMHDQGVRIIGRGLWYISAAHTEEDIDTALRISSEVFKRL